ncbi:MAG TPA: DUF1549 and DUF1553 domain-containing protein [Pirellulales bacterium]|jgi:hypothetical protein|nr:DUF1549 and DUF1553 domain-containing protein [Pirellulales bacterium]
MTPNQGLVAKCAARQRNGFAGQIVRVLFILITWSLAGWPFCAIAEDHVSAPSARISPAATAKPTGAAPAAEGIKSLLISKPSADRNSKSAKTGEFKTGDWPFRPLSRPDVPKLTKLGNWVRNPVDGFIGQKLEAAGIQPNAPADKLTLLRRVTFDLTGLPPTSEEQAAFLADSSPDAYAKVVDRLLASPRYGERWAQHWLDVVRYSETEGFKKDSLRPDAHRYRDYVIRAFNTDLPYDRFVREQIAGDELEPNNPEALIATGFIRLYPEDINASNMVQQRQEILDDITENTALAFMGLTVGCARCHDHKFDDIKQTDYYRLQACFAAILPADGVSIASKDQVENYDKRMDKWEQETKPIRDQIDHELADEREAARQDAISAYDPQTLAAINMPPEKRSCFQKQLVAEAEEWIDSRIARAYRRCDPEERKLYDQQMEELSKFDSIKPEPLPTAMSVTDGDGAPPPTCVLSGGNYLRPGQEVAPGFPEFLGASEPEIAPPAGTSNSTGRRGALAEWLTRADNPMTARVMINRLWANHFGQGIVATPNDFGAMGGNPSHPELLDWLAYEFISEGWHLKPIQRLMVLSATYCQASKIDPSTAVHAAALAADAADNLLWHTRRQRLEGEELRDAELQVSSQLNLRMYGDSAHPELPQVLEDTKYGWDPDQKPVDRNRRSIYVLAQRNMRLPLLETYDQPDMQNSCPRRTCTITAPQALEMLNGEGTEEAARQWSAKLLAECDHGDGQLDEAKLVRTAYTQAFGRLPRKSEIKNAEKFVEEQAATIAEESTPPLEKQLPTPLPAKFNRAKAAALVDFCHALMCSNEFLYVD